ncbi:hypothetical protein COCCADRAFT_23977 [Bipolaris zeicola 26-R-13]|uniref:Uncharacterized protein n=1 Tax=Cochliobolus carbonum (strain 26-R-13) TaxID=930089 RepID=W6YKS1_COCC2|nr:uncharacterized protein COCCADRAFT_23977 [Bipolaris zeicola 26-R-13]EUC36234.1 hypothetical protein COCCADRAFT_23977 [Bipolaris zeicola 26-R-13]
MFPVVRGTTIISNLLDRLEPLEPNNYIIALGKGSLQFIGSPNGYKAIGTHRPPALEEFLVNLTRSKTHKSHLRIRFGASGSFVAWSNTVWICSKVPPQLILRLQLISSYSCKKNNTTKGVFKDEPLDDVQWHSNGSFYAKKGNNDIWSFSAYSVSSAWYEMWEGLGIDERSSTIAKELAHVTISPYSKKGETFAFIKKTEPGKEPPFIVHFEGEQRHSNFTVDESNTTPPPKRYPRLDNLDGRDFRLAISKKTRQRPTNDSWDLGLNKGEGLLVLRDMRRHIGWVHGSWIDFCDNKGDQDPKAAYARFMEDLDKMFIQGQLQEFPAMKSYVDDCTKVECKPQKQDESLLGICIHDLLALLEGSGRFSYEWLKEGRNLWHPDRFARFCKPEEAERLKPMAEQMFVMHGTLMDKCTRR